MRSCRIGKSCRIKRGSRGRLGKPRSGTTSGRNSTDSIPEGSDVAADLSAGGRFAAPGIEGSDTAGNCESGDVPTGARRSASFGVSVGTDAGSGGTPGGDCTPGTPGKENAWLTDGNEIG